MPAKKKETAAAVADEKVDKKPKAKKTPKSAEVDSDSDDDAKCKPITKKSRKESSTGKESSMKTATKDLVDLSQEETEKGTIPYDYDAAIKSFNSKVLPNTTHYKIITWNVAGLRSLIKNGYDKSELKQLIAEESPDVLCLQETKLSVLNDPSAAAAIIPNYTFVESICPGKGYSGTRTYVRDGVFDMSKVQHFKGFDLAAKPPTVDPEGRVVTSFLFPADAKAKPLTIINNYVPNSGMKLEALDYRIADYDKMMRQFLAEQVPKKEKELFGSAGHIVWLGDLNVAIKDYDRFHNGKYKVMQQAPGFTPAERASIAETLSTAKLVDAFRHFFPNSRAAYTFYSFMFNQRAKGNGWRLDYFMVSAAMMAANRISGTSILNKFKGSDHMPSVLYVKKE